MSTHPLNSEEILVSVVATHIPTQRTGSASVRAPADEEPSVTDAGALALTGALDDLLAQLES